jgi:hypothetical protein
MIKFPLQAIKQPNLNKQMIMKIFRCLDAFGHKRRGTRAKAQRLHKHHCDDCFVFTEESDTAAVSTVIASISCKHPQITETSCLTSSEMTIRPKHATTMPEDKRSSDNHDSEPKIYNCCRKQPGIWYYSSNHVMINQERARRQIEPLIRLEELDEMALLRVEDMAAKDNLYFVNPEWLYRKFGRPSLCLTYKYEKYVRCLSRIMLFLCLLYMYEKSDCRAISHRMTGIHCLS